MKRINLNKLEHSVKIGDQCPAFEPNVTEDCIFYADDEPIGFFMRQMPKKMCKLADLADKEFRSENVPKSLMDRTSSIKGKFKHTATNKGQGVEQYSVILGSVPPKPMVRRPYPSRSSVHSVKTAQTFIKAMLLLAKESEKLIKEILPEQHEKQVELFKDVSEKWRFGNLFTSSISNYNIPAPFHRDTGNIKGAVNVIICKKHNSKGGDLHVPDYNATIGQQDNSILVYPAWRNVHGVTPIIPTHEGGYRNSLVFYALKAFKKL
ncbi:hypothetical protein [Nonlabens sp.]|uniref:hypothetical protein n=1 Tax=Nonlabens sp. TaxID=1888209 RepID=UPI0025EA50FB|nr:hypothetical protein [Nonlabens sp.]